jgi:hypothetical protein
MLIVPPLVMPPATLNPPSPPPPPIDSARMSLAFAPCVVMLPLFSATTTLFASAPVPPDPPSENASPGEPLEIAPPTLNPPLPPPPPIDSAAMPLD